MIQSVRQIIFEPPPQYPEEWAPAFVAVQLGFLAGATAFLGRTFLYFIFLTDWQIAVAFEVSFAAVVGIGFVLHTRGWPNTGIVLSCLSGVALACSFIVLLGWRAFFHIWLLNLAVLLLALPVKVGLRFGLAAGFSLLYAGLFVLMSDRLALLDTPVVFLDILGVSNILASLLILGIPVSLYARGLAIERKKSERLLYSIMPKGIAKKLQETEGLIALDNPEISVLFADIVSFTPMAESKSAEDLVSFLNDLFSQFDDLIEKYGVEKIKTMGDSYMVVASLPEPRPDHAEVLAKVAVEFLAIAGEYRDHNDKPIQLRIGLHSGPAISGVIGKSKFAFDLWGDTVNTAARLESHGQPGRVHVSKSTYELLKDSLAFCRPETVELKGKGEMETYLLNEAVAGNNRPSSE